MTQTQAPARPIFSTVPRPRTTYRFGITASAMLAALVCLGVAPNAACQVDSGHIGPSNGAIAAAGIGISAAVVLAIAVPIAISHKHHTLKGCVYVVPNGYELRTNDAKTWRLEGDPASMKAGDLVQFHGSRVKQKTDKADPTFRIQQLKKDYGSCPAAMASPSSAP